MEKKDKEFIASIEERVKNTIKEFKLLNKKDKIVVACSGGKDSTTVLYLLHKFGYNVEALIIDLLIGKWSEKSLAKVKEFCKTQKIKLHIVNMRDSFGCSICYIRSGVQSKVKLNNCAICGVVKRWILNKKARELGFDKIVTGHNMDDEVENVIMNQFKGNPGLSINLGPRTGVIKDNKFVPRVKPLYFCTNEEIRRYSMIMGFPVVYKPCPCSVIAFRSDVREFIKKLEKVFPEIKKNIINNFLEVLPILKKNLTPDKKLVYCKVCNEPSRNKVCKMCELMKILG